MSEVNVYIVCLCKPLTAALGNMVGLKPSDVPPPLGVKMASAGLAACWADIVTFPLDTAKVRLQVSVLKNKRSKSFMSSVVQHVFLTLPAIHMTLHCDNDLELI